MANDDHPSTHVNATIDAPPPPRVAWSTLTRDYLYSISTFLTCREFIRMSRVASAYRNILSQLPNREYTLRLLRTQQQWEEGWESEATASSASSPLSPPSSSLLRHVTRVQLRVRFPEDESAAVYHDPNDDDDDYDECNDGNPWVVLTPASLSTISSRLPRLVEVPPFRIDIRRGPYHFAERLPNITRLKLTVGEDGQQQDADENLRSTCMFDRMVEIGRMPNLVDLNLYFNYEILSWQSLNDSELAGVILDALLPLSHQLTSLTIDWPPRTSQHPWEAHMTRVRRFTKLLKLTLGTGRPWRPEYLDVLFQPSKEFEPMSLQRIDFPFTKVTQEWFPSFERITTFTHFTPGQIHMSDISFLQRWSQLQTCRLMFGESLPPAEAVVTALSSLHEMRDLQLTHRHLNETHLEGILTNMTKIESIILINLTALKSLSFLTTLSQHLSTSLQTLQFFRCGREHLPAEELKHLQALHQLKDCYLSDSCSSRLELSFYRMIHPTSEEFRSDLWPHLKRFGFGQFWTKQVWQEKRLNYMN